MLVSPALHEYWNSRYKNVQVIKRYGIEDESGETVVEVYLKPINLICIPNKSLFKLYKDSNVETSPIYVSKCNTIKELHSKICRVLSTYLYSQLKLKSTMVTKVRIWKFNSLNFDELKNLDSKYQNYTHAKINAKVLNFTPEQEDMLIHQVDLADNDIIIVELPKNKDEYVFQPSTQESSEHSFQDPLLNVDVHQSMENIVASLDINKLFSRSS